MGFLLPKSKSFQDILIRFSDIIILGFDKSKTFLIVQINHVKQIPEIAMFNPIIHIAKAQLLFYSDNVFNLKSNRPSLSIDQPTFDAGKKIRIIHMTGAATNPKKLTLKKT